MIDGRWEKLNAIESKISKDIVGLETDFKERTFTYTMGYLVKEDSHINLDFDQIKIESTKIFHVKAQGPEIEIYQDIYKMAFEECEKQGYQFNENCDFMAEVYTQDFVESSQKKEDLILDYYIPIVN